tara:strand:+ start:136 stop:921 length:786 start_codon:yes stop_codon:yes gene_type:complete
MHIEPADIFTNIRKKLSQHDDNAGISEWELHSLARDAKGIPHHMPDREAAEMLINARMRKFELAEKQADKFLSKWGRGWFELTHASAAYAQALCYIKSVECVKEAASLRPDHVTTLRNLEHLSMVAIFPCLAFQAKQELLRIGIPEVDVNFEQIRNELEWMTRHDATDEMLSGYFQACADVLKGKLSGQSDCVFATREKIANCVETGDEILCLDICVNIDGKDAASIQWDIFAQKEKFLPQHLWDYISVGIKPLGKMAQAV